MGTGGMNLAGCGNYRIEVHLTVPLKLRIERFFIKFYSEDLAKSQKSLKIKCF
jgi:hypothetical protein